MPGRNDRSIDTSTPECRFWRLRTTAECPSVGSGLTTRNGAFPTRGPHACRSPNPDDDGRPGICIRNPFRIC